MVKDILVSLRASKQDSPAEKYAIPMAAVLEAHIARIAFAYFPTNLMSQLGYMTAASSKSSGRITKERRPRR